MAPSCGTQVAKGDEECSRGHSLCVAQHKHSAQGIFCNRVSFCFFKTCFLFFGFLISFSFPQIITGIYRAPTDFVFLETTSLKPRGVPECVVVLGSEWASWESRFSYSAGFVDTGNKFKKKAFIRIITSGKERVKIIKFLLLPTFRNVTLLCS